MKEVHVTVEQDHLERVALGRRPALALAELIWNALDADAKRVDIDFQRDITNTIRAIQVRDNGTGITEADAESGFGHLGGSWKRFNNRTRRDARLVHGKEGKGRFHAFVLGSTVTWSSRYEGMGGRIRALEISGSVDRLGTFRISEPRELPPAETETGTEVLITDVRESAHALLTPDAREELIEVLAFYLRQYPQIEVYLQGDRLNPEALQLNDEEYPIAPFDANGTLVSDAVLTVVEWRTSTLRALYLCDPDGFALQSVPVGLRLPGFEYTAYLRASYIRELFDSNALLVGELHPGSNRTP